MRACMQATHIMIQLDKSRSCRNFVIMTFFSLYFSLEVITKFLHVHAGILNSFLMNLNKRISSMVTIIE